MCFRCKTYRPFACLYGEMTGKYPKIELDSFDDQCSIILGYMVFRLWRSIMSYKREVNYYQIIDKGEYLGSANGITNLNNKNNNQSCICAKKAVPLQPKMLEKRTKCRQNMLEKRTKHHQNTLEK